MKSRDDGLALVTNGRCLACQSPHRIGIDKRLVAGEEPSKIAEWLAAEGAPLCSRAIRRHRGKHLRTAEQARAIVEARNAAPLTAAQAIVNDADTLAEIASLGMKVARAVAPQMQDQYGKKSLAEVTLFTGALREAREASIARHEMLNGKQVNVDAHLSGGLAGLFAQLEVERKEQ